MPDPFVADLAWPVEIAKVAVPVALGLGVWAVQSLAQRAWNEYEKRRDIYLEMVERVDVHFAGSGGGPDAVKQYLRSLRKVQLVGSDEVVRAANHLAETVHQLRPQPEQRRAYSEFIAAMRRDLRTRRWLPPSSTTLSPDDFPPYSA